MSTPALSASLEGEETFRHEALFYAGEREFLDGAAAFVRDGLHAGEPVLVVVSKTKIDRLRAELGMAADAVLFADMAAVGVNPARIIPVWQEFVDAHPGQQLRGIGEPIWPGRSTAELAECHRHEALLNVAFGDGPPWWLLCPYDTTALDPAVVEEAQRTHPFVMRDRRQRDSDDYMGSEVAAGPFGDPLPEPVAEPPELRFEAAPLDPIRAFVTDRARQEGLTPDRVHDLVLAVNELVTNSLRYGGGGGRLRLWREDGAVLCEVQDAGRVDDPLVGRTRPGVGQEGGRGLWLANQLCDLVQLRSSPAGTVVRLHMRSC